MLLHLAAGRIHTYTCRIELFKSTNLQGINVIERLATLLMAAALTLILSVSSVWAQSSGLKLGTTEESAPKLDLGAAPQADREAPPPQRPRSAASPNVSGNAVRHGDWDVACDAGGKQCAMVQIGNDSEGTPVLEMVIRQLDEPLEVGERTAIAVLDVITPLGVVLPEGLSLKIDDGPQESAPFQVCTEQGCLVREPIDGELVARLKRGSKAQISVIAINQGEVIATISLSGFTKAFGSLK